ncbi:hypothetical protein L8C07_09990 [Paenibacillus sp. CMAA1739]|uniref:hypothetical protein n=1 Tax=Paenibacillus ottowii TaxID=2315729 RepID=UPI00272EF25C|nr:MULTISPECIES: hypothetical protein [Paenibacillus]MDP1511230.1 hypothetical protein [Paenibacillus ottowii]MEC4566272.1 hypothetical protein [Paenibacillus sp. CMAA1739]
MKKAVFSTLGLALLLSTSTAVASAQEAQEATPALQKESIQLFGNGTDREPNNWYDKASEVWLGSDIYGTIGERIEGRDYDTYDMYKFKAFQTKWVDFKIEGDKYPNAWLKLTLTDSDGHLIKTTEEGQNTLGKKLEAGKEYYLEVGVPGYEIGQLFWYKISAKIEE